MKQKRVAIITGASRGIGKAIALKLDKERFAVVLVSRSKQNLRAALKDFSKGTIAIVADVSKEKEVISMTGKTVKKFGRIDVLINNAGAFLFKKINEMTKKDFNQMVGTNFAGVFYSMRECIKQMKKQPDGGQIINISSLATKVSFPYPSRSLYCGTKAAVGEFASSVQTELMSDKNKIKIATIYPGLVFTDRVIERKIRHPKEVRKHALKSRDIAHVISMIINQDKNSNITEVVIQPLFNVSRVKQSK